MQEFRDHIERVLTVLPRTRLTPRREPGHPGDERRQASVRSTATTRPPPTPRGSTAVRTTGPRCATPDHFIPLLYLAGLAGVATGAGANMLRACKRRVARPSAENVEAHGDSPAGPFSSAVASQLGQAVRRHRRGASAEATMLI